jgi:hypothetical protein
MLVFDGKETKPMSRLHSDGTKILNAENQEVLLKGVNLGGWMFHETWYYPCRPYYGRAGLRACGIYGERNGSLGSVRNARNRLKLRQRPAVVRVCPANGKEWYEGWTDDKNAYHKGFKQRYIETVEKTKAAPFLQGGRVSAGTAVRRYGRRFARAAGETFRPDGRDELLAAFRSEWIAERDIEWLAKQGLT